MEASLGASIVSDHVPFGLGHGARCCYRQTSLS